MQTPDPILGLMDRFTAALNAHDLDAVLALVTDDIVFESTSPPPDGTRYQSRAAVAQVRTHGAAVSGQNQQRRFSCGLWRFYPLRRSGSRLGVTVLGLCCVSFPRAPMVCGWPAWSSRHGSARRRSRRARHRASGQRPRSRRS